MADRKVQFIHKDQEGNIDFLCSRKWGRVSKKKIVEHIQKRIHTYYVEDKHGRSDVQVVRGATGRYLRASPKGECGTKLEHLGFR